jgi:AraC-like DNA-binding protein
LSYDPGLLYRTVTKRLSSDPSISVDDLARELKVCRRTVTTTVASFSGTTFREFRGRFIVARVCMLLLNQPSTAIKELAFATGYKSPRSFARAVRRTCGTSPHELRASLVAAVGSQSGGLAPPPEQDEADPGSATVVQEELFVPLASIDMTLLRQYEEFTGAQRETIVTSALKQMFESHGEFWTWILNRQITEEAA